MKRDWTAPLAKKFEEGKCRVCRKPGALDAAHVIPRSLGGDEHPDATIPLCRSCHQAYDLHTLDLLPHLTKDEQAHAVKLVGMFSAYRVICGHPPE